MNYCSACGEKVELRIPDGDSLPRHVCTTCGEIHYQNPKVIVGCVAEWQGRILLCRRAIEPRYGRWTLPAGFMENGESTGLAAKRETFEEAGARIEVDGLFSLISLPRINQVHLFYRARLLDANVCSGIESLETALILESDIPWPDLAFRSVERCLKAYIADRRHGSFRLHEETLDSSAY